MAHPLVKQDEKDLLEPNLSENITAASEKKIWHRSSTQIVGGEGSNSFLLKLSNRAPKVHRKPE